MNVRKAISLLFMTLACCSAGGCNPEKWALEETQTSFYGKELGKIMNDYKNVKQSSSQNQGPRMKCILGNLAGIVRHMSKDFDCPCNTILKLMDVGYTIEALESVVLDKVSDVGLLNLDGTVKLLLTSVCDILTPVLGNVGKLLNSVLGTVTGLVGEVTNILGGVLGGGKDGGLLGSLLGDDDGLLGGLIGGGEGGGILGGLLGGGEGGGFLGGLLGGKKGLLGPLLGRRRRRRSDIDSN